MQRLVGLGRLGSWSGWRAYDYHLQSAQLQMVQGMSAMQRHCDASCLVHEERDTLALQ
jgi:hypothetical protein